MIDPLFSFSVSGDDAKEATVTIEPLRQGFGHTLGVALRRVMLSALQGAAVTKVRIKGVDHQFTTLKGMKEDIVEFVLNLKQLRVSYSGEKPETLDLQAVGPGDVVAKDLDVPATVTIANPELILATLADKKSKLSAEITVEAGSGYMTAEEQGKQKLGVIPIDASFSPVRSVSYTIESTRVGRRTDYDKLIFSVKTDGTLKPSDAVVRAASILIDHFQQIVTPTGTTSELTSGTGKSAADSALLKLSVDELGLPTRVANALHNSGYHTISDILQAGPGDLSKAKNIGQKSVAEILEKIREKGFAI